MLAVYKNNNSQRDKTYSFSKKRSSNISLYFRVYYDRHRGAVVASHFIVPRSHGFNHNSWQQFSCNEHYC